MSQLQWIIEPFRKASLSFAFVLIPVLLSLAAIFGPTFTRTNAIAAMHGEFELLGLPAHPWNDLLRNFAFVIPVYLFLCWLALTTASQRKFQILYRYRIAAGLTLMVLSTFTFLVMLIFALVSYMFFGDFKLVGPTIHPAFIVVIGALVLLLNGSQIIRLSKDSAK